MGKTLRESLFGLQGVSDEPVKVNPVVDPLAAETDPMDTDFAPQDEVELFSALKDLVQGTRLDPQDAYGLIKKALEKGEENMKKTQLETAIRRQVRKILSEALPKIGPAPTLSGLENMSKDDFKKMAKLDSPYKKKKADPHASPVTNPMGVEPTRYEAGASSRGPSKYRTMLQSTLGKMELDEPSEDVDPRDREKAAELDKQVKFVEETAMDDGHVYVGVVKKAQRFFIDFFETEEGDEVPPADQEDLIKNVTETKVFRDMFKDEFGRAYPEYMRELGSAVKDVIASGKNFSITKDSGGHDLVGIKDVATGLGVSVGQVMNIEHEALAKWVLEIAAGM